MIQKIECKIAKFGDVITLNQKDKTMKVHLSNKVRVLFLLYLIFIFPFEFVLRAISCSFEGFLHTFDKGIHGTDFTFHLVFGGEKWIKKEYADTDWKIIDENSGD